MRISSRQYAQTLFELTSGKGETETNAVVLKFAKRLQKDRQLKNKEKIIVEFADLCDRKEGIVQAEVTTVRDLDENQIVKIKDFLKNKFSAKKIILEKKIDNEIKGGMIIRVNDEVIDGSMRGRLKKLRVSLRDCS